MDANSVASDLVKLLNDTVSKDNTKVIDKEVFDNTFLKLLLFIIEDNSIEDKKRAHMELVNIWGNYCNSKLHMSLRIVNKKGEDLTITPALINLKDFHNGNFHSIGSMYELTLRNKTANIAERNLNKNIEIAKMKMEKTLPIEEEWIHFLTKYTGKQLGKHVDVEETYDNIEESYD